MKRVRALSVFIVLILLLASSMPAQQNPCVLKVGAWESFPEENTKNGGRLQMRKATVSGFTSTATNMTSRKSYKGVSLMSNVYYEDIPPGDYKITVRKAGFKTALQTYTFSCRNAIDGIDFTDILLFRGKVSEIIESGRIDRMTRLGSADSTPSPILRDPPRTISGGILNGKATVLAKPAYPPAAKAVRASGTVSVEVLIDESGNVVSAKAVGGSYIDMTTIKRKNGAHPLLISASELAARQATFSPTFLNGKPVKVSGIITYTFTP